MISMKNYRLLSGLTEYFANEFIFMRFIHSTCNSKKCLTRDTVNQNLKSIDFAIRGPLFDKAIKIENELQRGIEKPFKSVNRLNIGDAQSLGQPPITFLRQLFALLSYPVLLKKKTFPADVKLRAETILADCNGGSIGSYPKQCGFEVVRRQIAKYIEERDKVEADWKNCILAHGASDMARKFLYLLSVTRDGLKPGILNPVPEYPFYSSIIAELGMERIDYHLDEDNNWHIDINNLQTVIDEARKNCNPRAIVVINPGNPTSHVLRRESMEAIIKFAHKENLIILADEVYQNNILKEDCHFISFKRVLSDMGEPYSKRELVSLNSVSKGFFAESGIKGGYGEILNMDPEVVPLFIKSISAMILPSVLAEAAVYAQVNPPKQNEPSYEQFEYEKNSIMGALKISASIVEESFNSLEGVSCNRIEGALFCYARLRLPEQMIDTADRMGMSPDEFYALELLKETGICVVPGTGFGQIPGDYHIRMTLMPRPDQLHKLMEQYKKFHHKFIRSFGKCNAYNCAI